VKIIPSYTFDLSVGYGLVMRDENTPEEADGGDENEKHHYNLITV